MEVVREICNPQSEDLIIKLPREFVKKEIEVIILPFYHAKKKEDRQKRKIDENI